MTAVACNILAKRGLTFSEMEFMDHLVQCHGEWKLADHLTPDLNGNGSIGAAPLARLMDKLGCGLPGELEDVLKSLADG